MDNAPTVERARLSVVAARDDRPSVPPPETSYIGYNGYAWAAVRAFKNKTGQPYFRTSKLSCFHDATPATLCDTSSNPGSNVMRLAAIVNEARRLGYTPPK